MEFNPGFDIIPTVNPMGFKYGADVFGPQVENRYLRDIRGSLSDPHLLFGVVTYAAGRLGKEPIRSQGHIHWVSKYSGWSTPEVYEIWTGEAIIYMQEYAEDNPGRCFAVYAKAGDVVIVPPYWAHATISANPDKPLTFGAWCDRENVPVFNDAGKIEWQANPCYQPSELICKSPAEYPELGIVKGESIYRTFEKSPDTFLYVPNPGLKEEVWKNYEP